MFPISGSYRGTPSITRVARVLFVPAGVLVTALLLLLPGCSNEPSAPARNQESGDTTAQLSIGGGQVPQQITEGDDATLAVWGPVPGASWALDRIDMEVVLDPTDEPGRIEITAMGRMMQGPGSMNAWQGTVQLPPLLPGDYIVVMHGPGGDHSYPLRVLPGNGWVHFRSHRSATEPARILMIRHDGLAIAFRSDAFRPARVQLSADSVTAVRSWFAQADFRHLQARYLSDPPRRDLIDLVYLHEEGDSARLVLAEEPLMPEPLQLLVRHLKGLTDEISSRTPEPPALPRVEGALSIEPREADPGTERTIRLALINHADKEVTLTFRTAQTYDFSLVSSSVEDSSVHPEEMDDSIPSHPMMLVWNWAYGRSFPDSVTHITLGPRETRRFEEQWDGRGNDGEVVGPGTYMLMAVVPADIPVGVAPLRVIVRRTSPAGSGLSALLRCVPSEAAAGTPRTFTLSVTNRGDEAVTVHFPTSQIFDFTISDPMMMRPGPLWRWSEGKEFAPVASDSSWAAGETKVFTATWDGRFSGEVASRPGIYLLDGFLSGQPLVRSNAVSFRILR